VLNVCRKRAKRNRAVEVIHQDKFLLILNKPGGLVTLRTASYKGKTLQNWVEEEFGIRIEGRAGIVHRLDKETWGIILVAKKKSAFVDLQYQFKKREVEKTYWALVKGFLSGSGKIVAPLGRVPWKRFRFGVIPGGRSAETWYQVIKNIIIDGDNFTLIKVKPKTGRTHQLRVHLKYLGHPIFGDNLYGGRKERGKLMFLVAKEIEFTHPQTEKRMKFSVELPSSLASIIKTS